MNEIRRKVFVDLAALIGWLVLSFAAAAIGATASANAPEFYRQLARPDWAPPAWLFGPVWTVLYLLMGIAAWLVWRERRLGGACIALTLFLIQYWGGPTTYDAERGHPRLRMRHAPFAIGPAERDRWLVHMRAAMTEIGPAPDVAAELERYFSMAAEAMQNRA